MKRLLAACTVILAVCGCISPRSVKGQYVDSSGRGIAGARVTLWHESHFHKAERVGEIVTDNDGRFEAMPRKRATFVMVDNKFVRIGAFESKELVVERGPSR